MRVLFDSHIFANQKVGGVSRYHYEIYKGLFEKSLSPIISGRFVKNKYLLENFQFKRLFISDQYAMFSGINALITKNYLKKESSYDIFHPTDTKKYLLDSCPKNKPIVFTIHDMIPEKMEYCDPLKTTKYEFAKKASKIIAVSENTKQDIIFYYNLPPNKIDVIYHGVSQKFSPNTLQKQLPYKYLLFVGRRDSYKNFDKLIEAIEPLLLKNLNLKLICAGGKKFTEKELKNISKLGLENKIIQYLRLSDYQLAELYQNAIAFIFPSLYEGFGIPILESWACGTPAIISDASCFPEIAGDAALYFNPNDSSSILEAINTIINDSDIKNNLINNGFDRLNQFSWQKTVESTIDSYQSVL